MHSHLEPQVLQRLRNELTQIQYAKENDDLDPCIIELHPKVEGGVKKYGQWFLKFRGREGSNLYPGVYEIDIKILPNYPAQHPQCTFRNHFKHYHVYTTGNICLPLLKRSGWSINKDLRMLSEAIINMVHSQPTVDDPANPDMKELYKKSPAEYKKLIQQQSKVFAKYG